MAALLVLHGPNLNLLGAREPGVYGSATLEEIDQKLVAEAARLGHRLESFQSNAEHELIGRIQRAPAENIEFIIINPGAYTHTSIAIRDALLAVDVPFIEVHLSNVFAREEWRRHSYLSDIAAGVISGLGADGYLFALSAAGKQLQRK